jgi:hypothetical protein
MAAPDLSDYVEVKDRIAAFHEKYPEGSLQSDWQVREVGDTTLIVCHAKAYRTPDDKRPGIGTASEPFPGKTPYTKDSELMNAETSAWGRALAALGFEVSRAIASREEVTARKDGEAGPEATTAQKRKLTELFNKAGFAKDAQKAVVLWRCKSEKATKSGASQLIEDLIEGATLEQLLAEVWDAKRAGNPLGIRAAELIPSDTPADTEGLPSLNEPL